jgi:hypothetical protein
MEKISIGSCHKMKFKKTTHLKRKFFQVKEVHGPIASTRQQRGVGGVQARDAPRVQLVPPPGIPERADAPAALDRPKADLIQEGGEGG